ncbi:MAG TPA: division/cell wall cluster transcriptional repressor MraZ [Nevskiaceae bacterium]|nr:division/cell wall cluster transcriptional repressor MraZ [Nevskiaceae bacterium]
MLLGTYQPTLIDKNRLALPSKLRREIKGNQLILSVGMEDCIFGFEEEKWEQVTAADLSRPISDGQGRMLRRKLCTNAERVTLDSQGRFVVPEAMMKYAGVTDKLTLIGAGDHFEIWNKTVWETYSNKIAKENI